MSVVVRPATADDLDALLDVQQEGAVVGLAQSSSPLPTPTSCSISARPCVPGAPAPRSNFTPRCSTNSCGPHLPRAATCDCASSRPIPEPGASTKRSAGVRPRSAPEARSHHMACSSNTTGRGWSRPNLPVLRDLTNYRTCRAAALPALPRGGPTDGCRAARLRCSVQVASVVVVTARSPCNPVDGRAATSIVNRLVGARHNGGED